jgi:hypothetical protein
MTLRERLILFATRVATEIKAVRGLRGATNGVAPLDAGSRVPVANMPVTLVRAAQNVSVLPINWANGLLVKFTMPAANVTSTITSFLNPVAGETLVLILLNSSGATRNFVLPAVATHKTNVASVAVGNNQRRKLIAHFDGATYDWTVEATKTL